jgi:hypothetical protein
MKLYALAVSALHTAGDETAVGMQSALALLPEEVAVEEAGLHAARNIFPESEGWTDHFVSAIEITQGFPLEPYRLVWRIEKNS